jgi:argininosuccinate synthase
MEFKDHGTGWVRPVGNGFAISPSANALPHITRGLYVGVSGNVTVTLLGGQSVTFAGLAAGAVHPIACTHVTAATATGIIGLY